MAIELVASFLEVPPLGQLVHGPIAFVARCERHDESYFGRAFVGYVPNGARLGPSALTRIVRQASREAAVASRIASMLQVCVRPAGIAALVEISHHCTAPRLLAADGLARRTIWQGRYQDDPALRAEFLALCGTPP